MFTQISTVIQRRSVAGYNAF